MEALMSRRKLMKAKLTRIKNKLDAHNELPLNLNQLNIYEEQIQELWTENNVLFDEIVSSCPEEEEDEHEQQFVEIAERFDDLKLIVRRINEHLTGSSQASACRRQSRGGGDGTGTVQAGVNVQLPKLNIPTFGGEILEWTTFADLFTSSIHNHPTLKGSQKLQYLKGALSGQAATLLDAFQISDANYVEAWDTLRKRYQNVRELVKSNVQKLIDMPNLKCESGMELRKLVDTSSSVVRALKALNRPISEDCDVVMHIISTRVDPETTKLWETKVGRDRIPKLSDLLEFLDERAAILSSSETGKAKSSQHVMKDGGSTLKKAAVHQTSADVTCVVCNNGNHSVYSCKQFQDLQVEERRGVAKKKSLCYNCLQAGHGTLKCPSKGTCKKCQKKHHTSLHIEQPEGGPVESKASVSAHTANHSGGTKRALLATALVNITDGFGQLQSFRALLDPGADVSFVSERCVQQIGIARRKSDVHFSGLGSSSVGRSKGVVNLSLSSRCDKDFTVDVDAYVLLKVTGDLPKIRCQESEIKPFINLALADPSFYQPGAIDMLLGSDVFFASLRSGQMTVGKHLPVAHETAWGWIVGGECSSQTMVSASVNFTQSEDANLDEILTRFWRLEEVPKTGILTAEEKVCERHFIETTTRDESGRFMVELPFKPNSFSLGASRDTAVKRLRQMERALQNKPEVREKYQAFMDEYRALGHMELVPSEDLLKSDSQTCYIPHHAITTGKFRVVFDASSKTSSGQSLNDILMVGPKLQDDLFVILVRFRMFLVAFTADICKMFRQIWVSEKHRDFQRIVWRDSVDKPIDDYRLTTVTYGTSSAPYLSKRCLQLLSEGSHENLPDASEVIGRDFYMDDLMTGSSDVEKARTVAKDILELMDSARMDLRKWSSSSEELLASIQPAMRAMQTPFRIDEDEVIKTLGLYWLPGQDSFWFKVNVPPERHLVTKRTISSDTAKVFDPLGLVSPVTLVGKIMMQKLWFMKLDWDVAAPDDIRDEWLRYRDELSVLESIKIPRCLKPVHEASYELIGFSDASETACGAVVYLRSKDLSNNFHVSLVAGKTKVAPLQQKSLPRLELNGAVLLAHLMKSVADSFVNQPESLWAFSDSTVVLAWLKEHPKHWDTYVANRVSAIQDIIPYDHWFHIPGVQNPADVASRGIRPSELVSHSLWWHGPQFLMDLNFNGSKPDSIPDEALKERRKRAIVNHVSIEETILHRFSSLTKLQRVTAYIRRFSANCKVKEEKRNLAFLSARELQEALLLWVGLVQQNVFPAEVTLLKTEKPIPVKSRLRSLNPFVDVAGLLRVGGRLEKSLLTKEKKHPLIIPRHHILTNLIINHAHEINLHGSCQVVLAYIQRQFWIVNGRDAVRRQIRRCVRCCRFRAETATQMMGDLPSFRVSPARPFLKVGTDFAGPISLRMGKGNARQKGYVVIFICMVTRSMHLEVVTSMTTPAFIAVLKRFVARRGIPSDIFSDCGRTFVGANQDLRKIWKTTGIGMAMGEFAAGKGIKWHFNPPSSPHFGGLWESGIRSVKHHLIRVVGAESFNYEDMCTLIAQIEAVLNSRPLTQLSSDPNDLAALTPGHFIIGDALTAIPEP